jgi:hypothetical protein
MRNFKITQLDVPQIQKHMYDEENDAQRVHIIAGSVPEVKVNVDASAITEAVKQGLLNMPQQQVIITKTEYKELPIQTLIKEITYEKIEIPVIVKEIEYREIKVPYETVKIVEIEKPIYITSSEASDPVTTLETKILRVAAVIMAIGHIITLILKFKT